MEKTNLTETQSKEGREKKETKWNSQKPATENNDTTKVIRKKRFYRIILFLIFD